MCQRGVETRDLRADVPRRRFMLGGLYALARFILFGGVEVSTWGFGLL